MCDFDWGIFVFLDDEDVKGKVFYVWFEVLIGYISIIIEYLKREGKENEWKKFWFNFDGEIKVIYFIGKDNILFYVIFWFVFLMVYGKYRDEEVEVEWNLFYDIFVNEYFNFEGKKFLMSRNWVIWVYEFFDVWFVDYLRYYFIVIMFEMRDSDFFFEDFKKKINEEFVNNFGNFVYRVMIFVNRYFDGVVLERGELNDFDR